MVKKVILVATLFKYMVTVLMVIEGNPDAFKEHNVNYIFQFYY